MASSTAGGAAASGIGGRGSISGSGGAGFPEAGMTAAFRWKGSSKLRSQIRAIVGMQQAK
ncbi:hypothetical protein GIY62_17770 [Burkholderia plantarii]|uniref:hypothetical protein n=1 Tax=Burkholderia plantarii TaxID=41899 RepID=UPI00272CE51A|nr:hypothetical protein [Burkholderia plantarii]WLE58927.1 hypothetical protein GIY62_17770 [Burkholderia plantarii]